MDILIITILLISAFIVKHFVADFVLQTSWMAMNKHKYFHPGGWDHAMVQAVGTYIAVIAFVTPSMALVMGLLDMVVHHFIDFCKMNITRHYKLTSNDYVFWFWIGVDQLLHYATYLAITYWVITQWIIQIK